MDPAQLYQILIKFFKGEPTAAEKEELVSWLQSFQQEEERIHRLQQLWDAYNPENKLNEERGKEMLNRIIPERNNSDYRSPLGSKMMRWAFLAALVVAGFIIYSIIYVVPRPKEMKKEKTAQKRSDEKQPQEEAQKKNTTEIEIGGKTILLDSVQIGAVIQVRNTEWIKLSDHKLKLERIKGEAIIQTQEGDQYEVVLPHSQIRLNTASVLKIVQKKKGKTFMVKGEVLVQMKKRNEKPLQFHLLSSDDQKLGIVGLHSGRLNIKAYDGDPVYLTLLEGKGQFFSGGKETKNKRNIILEPGVRFQFKGGRVQSKKKIKPETVTAWTEGQFNFEGQDIQQIMREISRWYGVKVHYKSRPRIKIEGAISRKGGLSGVLKSLESTGDVHFKREGKEIWVLP